MKKGELATNFPVQPGDIITVPRTRVLRIDP